MAEGTIGFAEVLQRPIPTVASPPAPSVFFRFPLPLPEAQMLVRQIAGMLVIAAPLTGGCGAARAAIRRLFLRAQDGRDGANLAATRQAWPRTVEWFRRHLEP